MPARHLVAWIRQESSGIRHLWRSTDSEVSSLFSGLAYSCNKVVESRCGAVAVGWAYLFPPLSSGGASLAQPWLRFHIPLIEPDVQISRIRLSDKASRLRPRLAAPARGQAY